MVFVKSYFQQFSNALGFPASLLSCLYMSKAVYFHLPYVPYSWHLINIALVVFLEGLVLWPNYVRFSGSVFWKEAKLISVIILRNAQPLLQAVECKDEVMDHSIGTLIIVANTFCSFGNASSWCRPLLGASKILATLSWPWFTAQRKTETMKNTEKHRLSTYLGQVSFVPVFFCAEYQDHESPIFSIPPIANTLSCLVYTHRFGIHAAKYV